MTCLVKHQGDCCGCSDHPTDPPGSAAWLDHIDQAHAPEKPCDHERAILHWDGYWYCIWCDHQWQADDIL